MNISRRWFKRQKKFRLSFIFRVIICLLATPIVATILYLVFGYNFAANGYIIPVWLHTLVETRPQLEFVSDVSGFLGVVIGLAVPFGINIIQDISKYYDDSRVIKQRLQNEWQMQWLVPIFTATIFYSLIARLFLNEPATNLDLLRSATYTLLINASVGMVMFTRYIERLYLYTFNQSRLKWEIQNEINNAVSSSDQLRFLDPIEAYGDITLTEARTNPEVVRKQNLPYLEDIINKIVTHNERFILSQEFFELYDKDRAVKPNPTISVRDLDSADVHNSSLTEVNQTDYKKEARFRLFFNPSEYLVTYRNTLQQIVRIFNEGLVKDDDELSRYSIYSLIKILNQLCKLPKKEIFIDFLLRHLRSAAEKSTASNNSAMYAAATHWYVDAVFNKYNREETGFRIEYLGVFDKHLSGVARFMIREGHKKLFDAFVSYLNDGTHSPLGHGDVWNLGNILIKKDLKKFRSLDTGTQDAIGQITTSLDDSLSSIESAPDLTKWIERLGDLQALMEPHLDQKLQQEARKLQAKLVETATNTFKINNLREQIFGIGAYCIFTRQFDYLKQILEYNQPSDSDAVWVSDDIQPTNPSDVVNFYLKRGSLDRRIDFGEGHHGSGLYTRTYFLMLLSRALKNHPGEKIVLDDNLTPHSLNGIEYIINGLKQTAQDLKQQVELISVLFIDSTFIDDQLIPVLEDVNRQQKQKLAEIEQKQDISTEKVSNFKKELIQGFNESAVLRRIYEHNKLFTDQSSVPYKGDVKQYGLSQVDDKSVFFKEWYVSYGDWGKHYGNDIGLSENKLLYDQITDLCIEKSISLDDALSEYKNPLILTSELASFRYFESKLKDLFIPDWRKTEIRTPIKNIIGFAGVYLHNGKEIPVFNIVRGDLKENEILIIDQDLMGQFTQHSPLSEEFTSDDQEEFLVVSVKAFSSDKVLLEKFLSKPPKWLEGIGDKNAQEIHLKNKVLIRIYERFELQITNAQIGIRLLVNTSET